MKKPGGQGKQIPAPLLVGFRYAASMRHEMSFNRGVMAAGQLAEYAKQFDCIGGTLSH